MLIGQTHHHGVTKENELAVFHQIEYRLAVAQDAAFPQQAFLLLADLIPVRCNQIIRDAN